MGASCIPPTAYCILPPCTPPHPTLATGRRRSPWMRDASAPSATRSSIRSPLPSTPIPRGPVTKDRTPTAVREALGLNGAAAGSRHRRRGAAGPDDEAAVRALTLQRASEVLRIHHVVAGAHRHPRRLPRVGTESQRRRVDARACGKRDRSTNRPMDRRARSAIPRTAAGCS